MKDRGAMPVIERLPEEVLNSNPELYFIAVDKQPQYLHNVPKEVLQNNPEAYITVIKKIHTCYMMFQKIFKNNIQKK